VGARAGGRLTDGLGARADFEPRSGVALGWRDLDEAGEEQRSGSHWRQGQGTHISR
jgi:hypothetical protein